ncbi:MAG: signal peptide peptidase SppA [Gammaproteobacteria bacterium]|nr:signal peptide peptidase SppA [Gammaproteobacteria bacterium]
MHRNSIFTRVFLFIWHAMDAARKVMHFVLMLTFFVILLAALSPKVYKIPSGIALVLSPSGNLVEQTTGDPLERALEQASGNETLETQMRDLIEAVDRAADDKRVETLVLDLDGMGSAGLSKLQELGKVIDRFKVSGKPVIAMASVYSQETYYLAAHADEIYLHPMGMVILDGYERYRMFYKDGLDKLSIDWHVFRAGTHKSFGEPFTRNDMSEEDKSSSRQWLDGLWLAFRQDVSAARGVSVQDLDGYVNEFVPRLQAANGDMGKLAVEGGLVDGLMSWPEFSDHMVAMVGEDDETDGYNQMHFLDYLEALDGTDMKPDGDDQVAVIVASGSIVGGDQPPGTIGSESTARLIRQAADSEKVKAVVLRVDSGGGSAMASEFIREELLRLQATGKPLVVSMSSVAASGGYWISMSADEIWASPTTITGSIGVIAMFPTFPRALDRLGIHVDGVGTTPFSGSFRPDRPLSDDAKAILQIVVDSGYQDFLTKVAGSRDMEVKDVDQIGQGRVWTGARAHELGLVDKLGGLEDAVASAADLAGLTDFRTVYIEQEMDPSDRLLISMLRDLGLGKVGQHAGAWSAMGVQGMLSKLQLELDTLSRFNDPRGIYYHCFCGDQ